MMNGFIANGWLPVIEGNNSTMANVIKVTTNDQCANNAEILPLSLPPTPALWSSLL